MKYCLSCGKPLDDDANFCIFCASRQPDAETPDELRTDRKRCIACGRELDADANFCIFCASRQPDAETPAESRIPLKNCISCRRELDADANFCPYCMTKQIAEQMAEPIPEKKKRKPLAVILPSVASVLIIAVVCVALLLSSRDNGKIPVGVSGVEPSGELTFADNVDAEKQSASSDLSGNAGTDAPSAENGMTQGTSDGTTAKDGETTKASSAADSTDATKATAATTKTSTTTTKAPSTTKAPVTTTKAPSTTKAPVTTTKAPTTQAPTTAAKDWLTSSVSGGVEITGIGKVSPSGNYVIPSSIDGKTVVGIAAQAFKDEDSIRTIMIPNTVRYIGYQAFYDADGLTSITIPASVTSIGTNAFTECSALSTVYIRSTSISVETYSFSTRYQRNCNLTIYAPSSTGLQSACVVWDADYVAWNG